jgi:hypothetical protein
VRCWALLLIGLLATGCAVGNRYAYDSMIVNAAASGMSTLGVATYDQREYVRSGDKAPQFVGLQRGGYGNPFDVKTANDEPLADNMTAVIVNSLRLKGFRTQAVVVTPSMSVSQVRDRLTALETERALLLTLHEWKSDTYMNVGLSYDVTLAVLERAGMVLAERRLSGRDNLGGSFWNPPAHARDAVPRAFKAKIEELLNDAAVVAALRGELPRHR